MNIRHLFISGLIVGAAMFLPGNVFAEENELIGLQNSQKAPGQVSPSVGIDNAAVKSDVPAKEEAIVGPAAVKPDVPAKEEAMVGPSAVKPDVPAKKEAVMASNPSMKNQGGIKQQQSKVPPNNPASQKSAAASQNLHDQAKGHVQSALNKTEKAVNEARDPEKVSAVQEHNNGLEKNTPTPKNGSGNSDLDSLHNSETEVKKQVSPASFEPQGKDTVLSVVKKESRSEPLLQESLEKSGIPSAEEKIPKVSEVPTLTQRTGTNGGPSNDRGSQGLNTISFLDKWFVWNPYYEIQLVQSYLSQHTWLNNQWVNAPPSPPPIAAPFYLTFTVNLATGNDK
ncbi:hypothetical protein ABC255_28630 [Neobacillus sp. 3P2-tot-E-2]|uniref:hypothetical protein n=1 Tax=Neobacillus sp. 3P2-tot-E-2 TaxID=3132212 RepID=UPI0039A0D783